MRKCLLVLLVVLIVAPVALPKKKKKDKGHKHLLGVTFVSPVECKNNHGKWRWDVKTDRANPPAQIAPDHRVTVADMAAWEMPAQKITRVTPHFLTVQGGRCGQAGDGFRELAGPVLGRTENRLEKPGAAFRHVDPDQPNQLRSRQTVVVDAESRLLQHG
jgi:hypothetical protein